MTLEPLESWLARKIGLAPGVLASEVLASAVRARMAALFEQDLSKYLHTVQHSPQEFEQLASAVVVPETSFFRYPSSFELLRDFVTHEWRPAHPGGVLYVLSLPCCTGEEPYSIAMTLLDLGLPPAAFRILGVDLNPAFLATARQAMYSHHAFRDNPSTVRTRFFKRDKNRWRLNPEVAALVEFQQGNVLEWDAQRKFEVIFCRNLMVYLTAEARTCVLQRLARQLHPGGLLFLGHTESTRSGDFEPVVFPHAFACRHRSARANQGHSGHALPRAGTAGHKRTQPADPAAGLQTVYASKDGGAGTTRKPVAVPSRTALRTAAHSKIAPEELLAQARFLADEGHVRDAMELCQRLLRKHSPTAAVCFLLGLLQQAQGDLALAEESFRKALYLDSEHWEALLQLALLAQGRGDERDAAQLKERLERVRRRAAMPGKVTS